MASRRSAEGSTSSSALLFGAEVRHAREVMGYSQAELAKLLHCDRSLVTRIESGQRVPQDKFAEAADRALETDGLLTRIWSQVDWYAEVEHPDWFQRYARMEAEAVIVQEFLLGRVSGLLQTEEYARALFSRAVRGDLLEERVTARLSRQLRFLADDGPLLVVVLDESAIRTNIGGAEVMRGQLKHLLDIAQRPNIILQVAPFDRSDLRRPNAYMALLTQPDGERWVYSESLDRGHFSSDPSMITDHARRYELLRAGSLSPRESVALIASAMEGYDHDEERGLAQEQLQRRQWRQLRRGGPRIARRRSRA